MFDLKFVIYFICFFIFIHFVLHFFDIDIFELFEKKDEDLPLSTVDNIQDVVISQENNSEISNTIIELEKSIQELKDVSTI